MNVKEKLLDVLRYVMSRAISFCVIFLLYWLFSTHVAAAIGYDIKNSLLFTGILVGYFYVQICNFVDYLIVIDSGDDDDKE